MKNLFSLTLLRLRPYNLEEQQEIHSGDYSWVGYACGLSQWSKRLRPDLLIGCRYEEPKPTVTEKTDEPRSLTRAGHD
ncbi:MAG: hypothetical protein ACE5JX_11640 [Acidobacteriota bacterium]